MASKTLLVELQTALASYLDNHKNLSIQSISNKTGVSYSTIRRILQNEANDVRDETILSLILVVMPQAQRLQFMQDYYPALGALLKEAQSQVALEPALDHFKLRIYRFKDPHNYILKMAMTAHGTTRKDVFRILGERGVTALDEMIDDKFLFEDRNNRVNHPTRGSLFMNADDILHQIKKDADYYDKSLVDSQFARLIHLSASLSLSAYKELIELVSEFARKSERLKEGAQNQGAIPVFIDVMINTYDRASLTGVS